MDKVISLVKWKNNKSLFDILFRSTVKQGMKEFIIYKDDVGSLCFGIGDYVGGEYRLDRMHSVGKDDTLAEIIHEAFHFPKHN